MDAPPIQYARTDDGVNIAYWTMGDGPPLLWLPAAPWPWVVQQSQSESQAWFERIAQRWQLVQYDQRGAGLSRSQDVDHALDACMHDIDAVLAATGHTQVSLWAGFFSGPLAVAYAARNPDRVAQLILWCTFAASDDFGDAPAAIAPRAVSSGSDWTRLVQTLMAAGSGWSYPDYARSVADAALAHTTQEEFETAHRLSYHDDVTSLLQAVACPTLVMHRDDCVVPLDLGRQLAADVPGAQLRVFAGDSLMPELGNADEVLDAIVEFLPSHSSSSGADERVDSSAGAFRTILFTDVEASTQLTDRFGDAKARAILREHETLTRDALSAHGGTEIKTMGDGFMASFTAASSALDAAIAMQQAITEHYANSETPIRIRVGINAGEPIEEQHDLYGASVIRAARVMGQAQGGEILVADVVRQLVEGKKYLFSGRGEADLKGFEEPVRLFEVRWQDTD